MKSLLTNFTYFVEDSPVTNDSMVIEAGRIKKIINGEIEIKNNSEFNIIDLQGNYLVPGLIDLQVNGGKNIFFTHNITEKAIDQIYHDHLRSGITTLLPTLVTTSFPNTLKAIKVVRNYMKKNKPGIAGLHLEGPFINPENKGAHNPEYIRPPENKELKTIIKEGDEVIKMITIAPELFSDEQIEMIRSAGIVVAAGHSNISCRQAKRLFSKGITCVTHLFNAMSQLGSREPGLVGATLDSEIYAGIIVDGYHCNYALVRIAYKLKKKKLFLISDATLTGAKDFAMDGLQFIHKEGRYENEKGKLAGSNITLLDAMKNSVFKVGIPLCDAVKMATEIPSDIIGLAQDRGRIKEYLKADMVVLTKEGMDIKAVIKDGQYIMING